MLSRSHIVALSFVLILAFPAPALATEGTNDLSVTGSGDVTRPGDTVTVRFALHSPDDESVENASLALSEVPDDWTLVTTRDDGGTFDAGRWQWSSPSPDDERVVAATFRVPNDATAGEYDLTATAFAGETTVDTASVTVTVGNVAVVEGRVGGGDDETLVLAVDRRDGTRLEKATPQRLRDLAHPSYQGRVFTSQTDENGNYRLHVPRDKNYQLIALRGTDVSAIRSASPASNTTVSMGFTVESERDLRLEPSGGRTTPGGTVRLGLFLPNNDAEAVRSVTIDVGELPPGWTVRGQEPRGATFDAETLQWTWQAVESGEAANPQLVLDVPDNVSAGRYEIGVEAVAEGRELDSGAATVAVERPLDYETFEFDAPPDETVLDGGVESDAMVGDTYADVIHDGETDRFDESALGENATAFVDNTDFDESYLVVVQAVAVTDEHLAVEDLQRINDTTISLQTRALPNTDGNPVVHTLVVRVSRDDQPMPKRVKASVPYYGHGAEIGGPLSGTDERLPGFGVVASLVALAVVALASRRKL